MIPLYKYITQLCSMSNISLNFLETETGLSCNSISKWGKSIPSGDRILKVARYFDVSVDYLLGNTDNPKSHKTEPHYDVLGTICDFQEVKGELKIQAESFTKSMEQLSAFIDHKIERANQLGDRPVFDREK